MRRIVVFALAALAPLAGPVRAPAQTVAFTQGLAIEWEVKSRFRLFRYESDFLKHVAADWSDGILAAEQRLARSTEGHGWARTMLNGLCVDGAGRPVEICERDGEKEVYLSPTDHRIGVVVPSAPADATCAWSFENGEDPAQAVTVPCTEEVRLRIRYGRPTIATADITFADGTAQRATTEILVRDLLIAGLGDSVASGEGNPDRAITLTDDGFCFRRFLGTTRSEFFRPGRAGYRGSKSCDATGGTAAAEWAKQGARWMSAPCHRSLYSYQIRTALAIAIENPHLAVTFLPLACTGATIRLGLFESQAAREITCPGGRSCPKTVPAQLIQLRDALALARRHHAGRSLDLVLLTVGANDIHFSELVANAIIEQSAERVLFGRAGLIASVEDAEGALAKRLPGEFARLRAALKPLVGGDLKRVVYVSYPNPALQADRSPCPGGRDGFDVHPAFTVDGELVRRAATFVESSFLPRLKALALCEGGVVCGAENERMTFVDAHQAAFAEHGFCVRGENDPDFDNACFSRAGESFHKSPVEGAVQPLACGRSVREFRPYASRGRWIRTANDSYFAAMTYPGGLPVGLQPADIHDATWGVSSAVYGGAIHQTAEGHAAMADAALPEVRRVLDLLPEAPIVEAPLLPPTEQEGVEP